MHSKHNERVNHSFTFEVKFVDSSNTEVGRTTLLACDLRTARTKAFTLPGGKVAGVDGWHVAQLSKTCTCCP